MRSLIENFQCAPNTFLAFILHCYFQLPREGKYCKKNTTQKDPTQVTIHIICPKMPNCDKQKPIQR